MSRAPTTLEHRPRDETPLAMFDRTVAALCDRPLFPCPAGTLSANRVASLVDGLAGALAAFGIVAGDRVALHLQNDPQFVIGMLAAWRRGAIAVPCSPMLRDRELAAQLTDSGAVALITLDDLYREVGAAALSGLDGVRTVITTVRDELFDEPEGGAISGASAAAHSLRALAERFAGEVPAASLTPADVAVLTYTSGTTGPPKGAMNTHGNIAQASMIYREWLDVGPEDRILGIAPLYHVTGLTAHIGLSFAAAAPLILAHRFNAAHTCELIECYRVTVTVAAITAYVAIANCEAAQRHDLSSMRCAFSGGAPIAPATIREVHEGVGLQIRPVYGLTEMTGPTHLCPRDTEAPVHAGTGALAVGLTAPETTTRILDDDRRRLEPGEVGEVAIRGGQVVPGYWCQPEETAHALPGGEMLTADVGLLDEDGWLYVVDPRKDVIVASGFKVWPREVEDALYEHDAVREAAAIGVPDAYRGETVWAYVSLRDGADVAESELIDHCRARLSAYKYPRVVRVLRELPKTPSGKILRRELRELARDGSGGSPHPQTRTSEKNARTSDTKASGCSRAAK